MINSTQDIYYVRAGALVVKEHLARTTLFQRDLAPGWSV